MEKDNRIYVVVLRHGMYDEEEVIIEMVTTSLFTAETEVMDLLKEYGYDEEDQETRIDVEVWENDKYQGLLNYQVKEHKSYDIRFGEITKD